MKMQTRLRNHRHDDEYYFEENNEKWEGDPDYQDHRSARDFYGDPPQDNGPSRKDRDPAGYDREYTRDNAPPRKARGSDGNDRGHHHTRDDTPSQKERAFDGYNPPSQNSAVVETVYRKPKVYADLHEYDEVPVIDRVPTAIGYHSMDSADEIEETKSRASRYSIDVREEDEHELDDVQVYGAREDAALSDEEEDDKYSQYMKNPTLKSILSDDTESCPPIWRSFSEEKAEHGHDWALEEAKRLRALNSVDVPQKQHRGGDLFKSREYMREEQERKLNVNPAVPAGKGQSGKVVEDHDSKPSRSMDDTHDSRSKKSNRGDDRTHSDNKSAKKKIENIQPDNANTKKKVMRGLKAWVLGGSVKGTPKKVGGSVKSSAAKSYSNKTRYSLDSKGMKSKASTKSKNSKTKAVRSEKEAGVKEATADRKEELTRRSRGGSNEEKSRNSGKSGELSRDSSKKVGGKSRNSKQVENKTVESKKKPLKNNEPVESKSRSSKKVEDAPVESKKRFSKNNEPIESKPTPSKKGEDAPVELKKALYEPEESAEESGSEGSSSKLTKNSKHRLTVENSDDLIMKVRGQPVGGHSSSLKVTKVGQAEPVEEPVDESFFSYVVAGFNNLANLGFKEPLAFFDWGEEETKINKMRKASKSEDKTLMAEREDEEGTLILERRKNDDRSNQSSRESFTLDGSTPSRSRSKASKSTRQTDAKTQESEQEERDERYGREEKGRGGRGGSVRIREREDVRKHDEEQEREGLSSRSKSRYDTHADRRSRQVGSRASKIEQRIINGFQTDDEAKVYVQVPAGSRKGDGSSRHSREVKSLQLDGEEAEQNEAEQEASISTAPAEGLLAMSIEFPTPMLPSKDDDDCSLSILGLEKKHRTRPSKAAGHGKLASYAEDPKPVHMVVKQGRSSFIGKILGRKSKSVA